MPAEPSGSLIGSTRGLRVLRQLSVSRSFSAAGDALGLSQSAVSQHLSALERQVGLALVRRGTVPVELTAAGEALERHARAVLARLDTAEQEMAELAGRTRARLRVGAFPTALTTFVPEALARLRASHPDLALTVVDEHLPRLLPRFDEGELDVAVVYDHASLTMARRPELHLVHLFDDRFHAVLPRHHPAAAAGSVRLRDLARESWVGGAVDGGWFRIVRSACQAAGFDPAVVVRSDDYLAVQAFVAGGLGVAVMPGLAVAHRLPGVVVAPVARPAPVRRIWTAQPRGAYTPATAGEMVEILLAVTEPYRTARR